MTGDKTAVYKSTSQMVRKTKQVVMLYDAAIKFVKQAKAAIEEGRIEDRYNAIVAASEIIIGLQRSLDFENGGQIAKILYDYYAGIDMQLITVHSTNSAETCDQVVGYLKKMREAWFEIDTNMEKEAVAAEPAAVDMESINLKHPQVVHSIEQAFSGVSLTA